MSPPEGPARDIVRNRKAFHLYEILDRFEAGVALTGYEVKSVRDGRVHLKDAYAAVLDGELWLFQCHITPYPHYTSEGFEVPDPERKRKLLVHRKEIAKLKSKVDEKGLTLVPLRLYFKGSRVKVELGIGRGKKLYDKRESIKKRDMARDQEREMGRRG